MIVVAGEALIDLIVAADGAITAIPGGGPYNTARTIARLDGDVAYLGRISTDSFGRTLRAGLEADGVRLDLVVPTDAPTTLAVAELDATGTASYQFYVDGTSVPDLREPHVALAAAAPPVALHVGTLGLVLEPIGTSLERLVTAMPDSTLVMLDPNSRPSATRDPAAFRARIDRLATRADVVKVSDDDLAFMAPDLTVDLVYFALDPRLRGGLAVAGT